MRLSKIRIPGIVLCIIATVGITLTSACGGNQDAIRIGVVADLTGPMALYGGWVNNGAQIALDEIIKNGGIGGYPVELTIEDSQSDPTSAVSAIQKLISMDGIRLIVGGNGSSATMAMAPVANETQSILFVALASSPTISDAGDYIFRNRLSGMFEAKSMAEFAIKQGFTRVAVAAINNEAGVPYIDAFQSVFEELGGSVPVRELMTPGETSFRSQVISLNRADPEAVFAILQVEQAGHLIKQCTEQGFNPTWLGVSSFRSEELLIIAGEAAEGTIITAEGVDESNPEYQSFASAYRERFGEEPTIYAVNGYDAVMILATLEGRVGDDPDMIKKALYDLSGYVGAGGELRFDSNGDAIRQVQVLIVREGKFVSM